MIFSNKVSYDLKHKRAIKIIAGINNLNVLEILKVVKAAELADVSYLDVVANTKIVKYLKSVSNLPICISSIDPLDIYNCLSVGADIIEIGNYNSFYKSGIYFATKNILDLVKEIQNLVADLPICVTVPYYLDLEDQIILAQNLEFLGVHMIQTEGLYVNHNLRNFSVEYNKLLGLNLSKSLSSSLLSTYVISQYVKIPIISSSGMIDIFAPMAKTYGASGIGIGASLRKHSSIESMVHYIRQIKNSIYQANNFQKTF